MYKRQGEVILSEGSITENIGIVLSGMAMISCNDIWGNTSILGNVAPGSVFAEVYACIPGQPMLVTVSAAEDTSVLFMNVGLSLIHIWQSDAAYSAFTGNPPFCSGAGRIPVGAMALSNQAGTDPVSYTHLDVYKRQLLYCS